MADDAIDTGQTPPPSPDVVRVVDKYGQLGTMNPQEAQLATNNGGFRYATPDEVANQVGKETYGHHNLAAAAAGAARGVSFGLSDQALTGTGLVAPETLAGLKKYNPVSSGLGEAAGIGGSLLATAGGSGAAEAGLEGANVARTAFGVADLANPVAAVSKLGARVSEAATPATQAAASLIANPETSSLANRIISQASASALGSAVEGSAYGLGQSISENALGDPDLNGEKVLSNIGYSGLFGGALGGILKAGEIGLPASIDAARNGMSDLYDKIAGTKTKPGMFGSGFAKASSFVSGKPEDTIIDALQNRAMSLKTPEEQIGLTNDFTDGLQKQYSTLQGALKTTFKDIRPEEINTSLADANPFAAKDQYYNTGQKVDSVIKEMEAHPALYPGRIPAQLRQVTDEFSNSISDSSTPSDIYHAINDLKQNIDKKIKFGSIPSGDELQAQSALKSLRSDIKTSLENSDVWGQAGSRQAAFNDAFNDYQTNLKEFQKRFMYKTTNRSGAVEFRMDPSKVKGFLTQSGDTRGILKNDVLNNYLSTSSNLTDQIQQTYQNAPGRMFDQDSVRSIIGKNQNLTGEVVRQGEFNRTMNSLGAGAHNAPLAEGAAMGAAFIHPALGAAIEGASLLKAPGLAIQRLAKIERLATQMTNSIATTAKAIFKGGALAAEPFAGYLGSKLTPEQKRSKSNDMFTDINRLGGDPQHLVDQLQHNTQDMHGIAPNTTGAVQQAATRATQFLQSKIPQQPNPKPLSSPTEPSQADLAKFQRYYQVVENPTSVLKDVKNNTITPEAMEALSTVYPKMYQEMQKQVMNQMTSYMGKKNKDLLPHSTKLSLSLFMGQDLIDTLAQPSIAANMAAMAAPSPAQQQNAGNQQKVRTSQKGLSSLTKGTAALTPMQLSAQRGKE